MESAATVTFILDQVYGEAKNDWLRKRDNAQIFFEAKHNGMLSSVAIGKMVVWMIVLDGLAYR